jgi:hypothetical protein
MKYQGAMISINNFYPNEHYEEHKGVSSNKDMMMCLKTFFPYQIYFTKVIQVLK